MILDVGCGASPQGDVNCDLMVHESDEKWSLNTRNIRNFVKADIKFLPFKTNLFEIVYCSHVLEHLQDIQKGIEELRRVSKRFVVVVLPFALFSVFDIFWCGRNFGKHIRWLRQHHKHFFLMDPLKTGSFKLMFPNLKAALRKQKSFKGGLRLPIPFQTLTVLEV